MNIENGNEIIIKYCNEIVLILTDGSNDQNGHTGFGITFSEEEICKRLIIPRISKVLLIFQKS